MTTLFIRIWSLLITRPVPAVVPARPLRARAVSMLEWVLLAAIMVTLAWFLRGWLTSVFSTLVQRIQDAVSN